MNIASLRSSRSSYGDPRYLSAYSNGAVPMVPSKALVNGYRGTSDLSIDDRSQYSVVRIVRLGYSGEEVVLTRFIVTHRPVRYPSVP